MCVLGVQESRCMNLQAQPLEALKSGHSVPMSWLVTVEWWWVNGGYDSLAPRLTAAHLFPYCRWEVVSSLFYSKLCYLPLKVSIHHPASYCDPWNGEMLSGSSNGVHFSVGNDALLVLRAVQSLHAWTILAFNLTRAGITGVWCVLLLSVRICNDHSLWWVAHHSFSWSSRTSFCSLRW